MIRIKAQKQYAFRDPIHGQIEVADRSEARFLRKLISTFEFQRLRRVAQNGVASLVFPGLESSRFIHSLGSYAVASRLIEDLKRREPAVSDGFPDSFRLTGGDAKAFALAALLHDVGHGPFSHLWEECFYPAAPEQPAQHEVMGLRIIDDKSTELGAFLDNPGERFSEFLPVIKDAKDLLRGRHRAMHIVHLLSGNLDVDRFDYMARDAQNAGVVYGAHERDWMMRAFKYARIPAGPDAPAGAWVVALDGTKGAKTLKHFLRAREAMYEIVYHHKTNRAASFHFCSIMRRAASLAAAGRPPQFVSDAFCQEISGTAPNVESYVGIDDSDVWVHIKLWSLHAADSGLRMLCRDFLRRKLFKAIHVSDPEVARSLIAMACTDSNPLSQKIAARMNCSLPDARFYYGVDVRHFRPVGRKRPGPYNTVWIAEKPGRFVKFSTLHEFWVGDAQGDAEQTSYCLCAHERCIGDLADYVDSLTRKRTLSMPQSGGSLQVNVTPSAPPVPCAPPNFSILSPIGQKGQWKETYLATTLDGVPVALKRYKDRAQDDLQGSIRRDVTNIRALLPGGHRHVATPEYLGEIDGSHWLKESLWDGSLLDVIEHEGPVRDIADLARIGEQLFDGLAAMHGKNLRHTDIKPDNCGFRHAGPMDREYLIGDLGCMSSAPEQPPESVSLLGTQRTRAPEVVMDVSNISLASDVWALCATIYALCMNAPDYAP